MNLTAEQTPKTYQGAEIKSVGELSLGDFVMDTTGGLQKLCRVVKRYKFSVKLELVANGKQYGQSLHQLRRVA